MRHAGVFERVPVLERLLTRATAPSHVADWRVDAFRAIAGADAPMPSVAAAAAFAADVVPAAWYGIATPVHLVAGMTKVTLSEGGLLDLEPGDARSLAVDFNRVFGDAGVRLAVGRHAVLLCVFDRVFDVVAHDPETMIGDDVFGFQPTGMDAARWRRWMSEIELWLFEHEVNRARSSRGLPSITGLWFWGGGAPLAAMPPVHGWTAGRDPLFAALGTAVRAGDAGAASPLPSSEGAGVVVSAAVPGSALWPDIEARWLEPALANLRAGRIQRLALSAGPRCVVISGRGWRFWRRPRPWWESFELAENESHGIQ